MVLPFGNVAAPVWSRDAAVLAVNATSPNRPNEHSINAYVINAANGGVQQITNFQDTPADAQTGTFQWLFSQYEAFSPDRSAIVIESLIVSGGRSGSTRTTPILEVYSTATPANPALVHVYTERTGLSHHAGEGVDWHPGQNLLVTPFESSARFQSGSSSGQVTALFLLEPVAGAVDQGRSRQLTFPRADVAPDFSFTWSEHDYQPRFSPNGIEVAYVRSFQSISLARAGRDPNIQSIRILNLNTGAETEVLRFNPGGYVGRLEWSADGTALAFDLGQQESGVNGLQQNAVPQTNEIYVVDVDGSGLRRLRSGGTSTPAWPITAPPSPSLGNISTRLRVGDGDDALIGGFIITGNEQKRVLLRAIGPSLASAGVQGALQDTIIELNGGGGVLATNDNWRQAPNANEIPQGFTPGDERESAIVTTLTPGSYTAIVRGANGATGVGLIEAYDLSSGSATRLANISTRGRVDNGDNVLIGGFIAVGGPVGSARVLVRAIGPSLAEQGIDTALQNPILELFDANGSPIAMNNDWRESQQAEVEGTTIPPRDNREAAIVQTLAPGAYTAVVRGVAGGTGVGLVEVYSLR